VLQQVKRKVAPVVPAGCHISAELINTILQEGHIVPHLVWLLFDIDPIWVKETLQELHGKDQNIFWNYYFKTAKKILNRFWFQRYKITSKIWNIFL